LTGRVYLVGAGPGDPGLITQKGLRCLEKAQVVVYDRLLDPSLLQAAPLSAERVFVGKERGRQAMTQEEINQVLIDRAAAGLEVVRLKGGDPFVFGRGAEEALALTEHGIAFEVVPGVTSPIGAAAYAGIPLTHRGISSTFTVVSGSEDPSKPDSAVSWDALARTGGTLVVLMGWARMEAVLDALRCNGMDPGTPVALVQWGTWLQQKTVTGCLENIVDRGRQAGLEPPVIAVLGKVVELREQLRWFDRRPLWGKRVLITRSRSQASKLRGLLEDLGASPIELPTIQTVPLEDYAELDAALDRLAEFSWVIFASANGVESVFSRLGTRVHDRDARAFRSAQVGAIGPATAQALERRGIIADYVPANSTSETLAHELSIRDWTNVPVLLPGADIGRDLLAQGLTQLGAQVKLVAAYRTVAAPDIGHLARIYLDQGVDIVTFTSSSTVRNLLNALDGDGSCLKSILLACIGPATAATARELGLHVDLVAAKHNVEGLAESLVAHFGSR
jgi:uroporphyrinogen III methyltransferase/synthase